MRHGAARHEVSDTEAARIARSSPNASNVAMRFISTDNLDPLLEIHIDDSQPVVVVRLIGILDQATGRVLLSTVDGLLQEGLTHFMIDANEAHIADASGATALTYCQRRVREVGGIVSWDGIDHRASNKVSGTGHSQ